MSDHVYFNAIHAFTFYHQYSGTQKSNTHLSGLHSESEAVTTRKRKSPDSHTALQTAGHSPAGSSTWSRVSLGAGTSWIKALFSPAFLAALQLFPPSHKRRAAFLMIQHWTRFLSLIPRSNCSQNYAKKVFPNYFYKQVANKQAPSAGRMTHLCVTLFKRHKICTEYLCSSGYSGQSYSIYSSLPKQIMWNFLLTSKHF